MRLRSRSCWPTSIELNAATLRGEPDVAKVSFSAFAQLRGRYALLHAGGALGRGCGPLLVAREGSRGARIGAIAWTRRNSPRVRIAIPGRSTTAALLLRLFAPAAADLVVMPFDRIMPAVACRRGAGRRDHPREQVHLSAYGLRQVVDLGEWWESTTGHAHPLGGDRGETGQRA